MFDVFFLTVELIQHYNDECYIIIMSYNIYIYIYLVRPFPIPFQNSFSPNLINILKAAV